MHRLFVAIRPPAAIRARLLALMEGVRGARWQDDDQLHLTLRFIGEVDRHLADDIDAALGDVRHPRFDICLSGISSFERRGRLVSVWAGLSPREPLEALHRKIDLACRRAGLEADRRAYLPHITLARLNSKAGPIDALLATSGGLAGPSFTVDAFCLVESELGPAGSRYAVAARYSLS